MGLGEARPEEVGVGEGVGGRVHDCVCSRSKCVRCTSEPIPFMLAHIRMTFQVTTIKDTALWDTNS